MAVIILGFAVLLLDESRRPPNPVTASQPPRSRCATATQAPRHRHVTATCHRHVTAVEPPCDRRRSPEDGSTPGEAGGLARDGCSPGEAGREVGSQGAAPAAEGCQEGEAAHGTRCLGVARLAGSGAALGADRDGTHRAAAAVSSTHGSC